MQMNHPTQSLKQALCCLNASEEESAKIKDEAAHERV